MKKNSKLYVFSLIGVNIEKVHQKYGILPQQQQNDFINNKTTKIDDLEIKSSAEIVSFLDESKRLRKCIVSTINFDDRTKVYKCFWDKNCIPNNIRPIGCPIKYIPHKANKTYLSHISKEKYSIYENITEKRYQELDRNKTENIILENKGYYETDGIFCSFNCCMAFIECSENRINPMYKNSKQLLLAMYNDLNPSEIEVMDIMPAPDWRTLIEFGGHLSIEKFRETFNKVLYVDYGIIRCKSVGKIYEDQIKF